jgi:hypothetical protein
MKINKDKILRDLQRDKTAAEIVKRDWDAKRETWISETYGQPYGNEVEGKSKIVSKDIKKQLEWLIPRMTDPFLSTPDVIKCTPVTFEDELAATQNELLLNTQFCRKFPRYNFVNKAARVLATEGTVVIQTGWDYEDEEVTELVETIVVDEYGNEYIEMVEQEITKVIKNQPTARVCRNEDIYIDPTCMDDMDKCQFVIYRYETDMSTLKQDGRYKNLDKIRSQDTARDVMYIPEDDTRFNFEDDARKKLVVYEYWGNYDVDGDGEVEPIVCAWVDNTIIRLEENPYPDKKPPFVIAPFNSVPFQMFGEALAENIGDNQKIKTAVNRGIIDNMARSNNSQIGVRRGALDINNKKKFLQGKNFEFNGTPADFWQGQYNQIPGSVFDMLALMNNEIESQTGVKSFSGGITGNALGSTATSARGAMDATAMRGAHLVRNVAENLMKPLMRKWMAYNAEFLEEEEVIRITNNEFVPIRRDDLAGRIDIDLSISTQEDNAARSQELAFLLQTLGNSIPFELTQLLMADIVDLHRMPDKAKMIREYKPQPDPMQEQAKQLELAKLQAEVERLKADAAQKIASSQEDEADKVMKMNKAMVEAAKARKLESEADLADLKHIKEDAGYAHLERLELQDQKHAQDMSRRELEAQYNMMLAELQAKNNDSNIGLMRR